jgi:hypothetical protein
METYNSNQSTTSYDIINEFALPTVLPTEVLADETQHTQSSMFISIVNDQSYDKPARSVVTENGIIVHTKRICYSVFNALCAKIFIGNLSENIQKIYDQSMIKIVPHALQTDGSFDSLINNINKLSPSSVIFNFECCSGIKNEQFPNEKLTIMFIFLLVLKGHIVQVADYTLKSLIAGWNKYQDDKTLFELFGGECPFVKTGECDNTISLKFSISTLSSCCVPQLRAVALLVEPDKIKENKEQKIIEFPSLPQGLVPETIQEPVPTSTSTEELSAKSDVGSMELHAMASTITVSYVKRENTKYECDVLTLATNKFRTNKCQSNLQEFGHAVLRYPEGGMIICSAGHFCELQHINTSKERLRAYTTSRLPAELSQKYEERFTREMTVEETARTASELLHACSNDVGLEYSKN